MTHRLQRPPARLTLLPGVRGVCVLLFAALSACGTSQPPPVSKSVPPAAPAPSSSSSPSAASPSSPTPPAGVPARPLPNVNLSGYPPAFKEGFRDGCDSFRGTYRRDNSRFGKNNDYTIGWQDGFSICKRQGK